MAEFIVDQLLPAHEIHLVAGPTGAGKTRWLLETILTWQAGLPVLTYKSYPCPWIYIAADRTKAGALRTINALGINPEQIPLLAAWDRGLSESQILDAAKEAGAKLLVWESFGSYIGTQVNSKTVKNWLNAMGRAIEPLDMTIIGIVEQPKMKPNAKYGNPRQRVSGPAAWGHHTETIFLAEHYDESNLTDPRRWLYVCPRNVKESRLAATMESGHFVILGEDHEPVNPLE